MTNDIEEVKAKIGKEKFYEIQAFARKLQEEGKTPEEVKTAIGEAYRKDIEQEILPAMVFVIT